MPPVETHVATVARHAFWEDAQALLSGTLCVALGVAMFKHAGLLSGGTAGLAFLLHYGSGVGFGILFFVINLPFYGIAWRHLDRAFAVKTMAAVLLLSLFTELQPQWLRFALLPTPLAALLGGLLIGTGFLMLFRHRASLGGVSIVAQWLQQSRGWRAGWVQLAVDSAILVAALFVADAARVGWSLLGALSLNLTLAVNHRPGRYLAT